MPRTNDIPGQALMFPPADCPRQPADGPPRVEWREYRPGGALTPEADARRTEALRKRDERREQKR